MIVGIIKNKDNSYEYINIINNKLDFVHIDKNGVKKSNKDYIDIIFKNLFYNDNCVYLEKYKDYDVYYDRANNLRHYMKNGIENLELFYTFNGMDARLYKNSKNNEPKDSLTKHKETKPVERLIAAAALSVQILILSKAFLVVAYQYSLSFNKEEPNYKLEKAVEYIYNPLDVGYYKYMSEKMTYQDAINYIYDSDNLTQEEKEFLANEELLQDVFSYYSDTSLEYIANINFKNLNIIYENIVIRDCLGYYSPSIPNTLHISKKIDSNEYTKGVIAHEFIHLLQVPGCPYKYIIESSAELLTQEYFNCSIGSYSRGVKNLQLLIDIIGPQPIMKLIFAGDDETFNNILKNNLSEEQYKKLILYFQDSTIIEKSNNEKSEAANKNIKNLLCTLYKNIYGKDITEDKDILYTLYYDNDNFVGNSDKYYLNVRKMQDIDTTLEQNYTSEELKEKGILKEKEYIQISKKLTLDEYIELKKNDIYCTFVYQTHRNNIELKYNPNHPYNLVVYIHDTTNGNIKETLSAEEAVSKGYITIIRLITIDKEDQEKHLEEGWLYNSNFTSYGLASNNLFFDDNSQDRIIAKTNGIKNRFNDQYERMISQAYDKSNSKKHI